MGGRELPILNFGPFRKYPTKSTQQAFEDELLVCHSCVSGVCCATEDPIALTGFDIFRLAAFFDMTPAEFMLSFTQDRFDGEDSDETRRGWNDDPDSSIVTWLRRRGNFPSSPCIFLKYVRDPDGTPRRICGVHDARPLSCREYYYQHCKARGTGELASLLAEGYEKVRDGEITEAMADAELARLGQGGRAAATLAADMEYSFWVEMKRVVNLERANTEGANSYDMAEYQDPIDEKLNRALSAKNLRFEEKYGARPRGEQLMPYTSGLSFAGSPEHARIMAVRHSEPSNGLFERGDYPHWVGARTMLSGAKPADVFPMIPDAEVRAFLSGVPPARLFPNHDLTEVRAVTLRDVYAAVLKAYNHLLRFASHVAALEPILEFDPPGTIEVDLLSMISGFTTSLNPYLAHNPYFEPVKLHAAEMIVGLMEEELAAEAEPQEMFNCLRLLCMMRPLAETFPPGLRARVEVLGRAVHSGLRKDSAELYVSVDDFTAARRPGGRRGRAAWAAWRGQARDMSHAAAAGFDGIDLPAYYGHAVNVLEHIPLRRSHGGHLSEMVNCLAHSMTSSGQLASRDLPYRDAADRLGIYAVRLFGWMRDMQGDENLDWETLAGFATAYKLLGLGYGYDYSFGLIVHRLLAAQLPDGSWGTNLSPESKPGTQGEYLQILYQATWACVDGLRPLRNDPPNGDNPALGLV
jgi:Fe-S-cluster containining protein